MAKKFDRKVLFAAWACHNRKWHTYQLFDNPLRTLFSKVSTFDPKEVLETYGKSYMNRKFIEVCAKEKPDYIFLWVMHDEFYPETLIELRKLLPDTVTFCYNGDDDYKFYNHTIHFFPLIDYFITTQPPYLEKYKKYGKVPFFGCGADITEFKPMNLPKKYDVSFVGTPKNDRVEFMRHLLKNNVKFVVCGAGWEKYPEFKPYHLGEVNHEQFIRLINESKINICLSKNYFGGVHILERFFEINACRSLCLTEYAESYFPTFKEGKDIVTFKNKDELLKKVQYYLKHDDEREAIANSAYKKTIKSFSNIELIRKAVAYMEKHHETKKFALQPINKRFVYLEFKDLLKGKAVLSNELKSYDYVCFRHKGYQTMKYKDYFQMHALELTKKDISCCDAQLNSRLIGDYAYLQLNYLFDLKDKSYFYDNLDISQLMVRKNYLLNNLDKFASLYQGKKAFFVNRQNTNFISLPFVRTKRITKIPFDNLEHIFFGYFEMEMLSLKRRNLLLRSFYPLKLLIYSLFVNQQILKIMLLHSLKRTKIPVLMMLSQFSEKFA